MAILLIFNQINLLSILLRTVCLSLVVLCFVGCRKSSFEGNLITDAGLANDLLQSPPIVQLEQNEVLLKANLWRDFMPISPEDGKPLICVVTLFEVDSASIAGDIERSEERRVGKEC